MPAVAGASGQAVVQDQVLLSAFASLEYIAEHFCHFLAHPTMCEESVVITLGVRGHHSAWAQGSWVTCV